MCVWVTPLGDSKEKDKSEEIVLFFHRTHTSFNHSNCNSLLDFWTMHLHIYSVISLWADSSSYSFLYDPHLMQCLACSRNLIHNF